MNPQQNNLAKHIRDAATVTVENLSINLLKALIPGLSDDTIASLCYLFPTETITRQHLFRLSLETAYRLLEFLVSPRLLHHLQNGQFESISLRASYYRYQRKKIVMFHSSPSRSSSLHYSRDDFRSF
jgi:hypothetical protein